MWMRIRAKLVLGTLVCASIVAPFLTSCLALAPLRTGETKVEVTGSSIRPERLPVWNVWIQESTPGLKAGPDVRLARAAVGKNQPFALAILLSAATLSEAVLTKPVSPELSKALLQSSADTVSMEVISIPDKKFFRRAANAPEFAKISVNAKRYRELYKSRELSLDRPASSVSIGSVIEAGGFDIGSALLEFESLSRTGLGSIAISFWVDRRPIDEMSVPVCIVETESSDCSSKRRVLAASLGTLGQSFNSYPDASIHILELNEERLAGVLFCNMCGHDGLEGYATWELALSSDAFLKAIRTQAMPAFEAASKFQIRIPSRDAPIRDAAFRTAGKLLYDIVFEPNDNERRPQASEAIFQRLVASARLTPNSPPTLFTRMIASDRDALLLPINSMLVPTADGKEEFLGFLFVVESFLTDNVYVANNACIDNWTLLLPKPIDGQPMADAVKPMEDWISRFDQPLKGSRVFVPDGIDGFRDWLSDEKSDASGMAVVTFSHHFESRLCFSGPSCDDEKTIYAANVQRRFASPSLVVLNGCGTGGAGATAFVDRFGSHGISTVIATSAQVDQQMAGHFLGILVGLLAGQAPASNYTISRARFEAVTALSKVIGDRDVPYGPAALNYILVGNGQVRACLPSPKQ